jgi:iron complex outermembrane receptor protein
MKKQHLFATVSAIIVSALTSTQAFSQDASEMKNSPEAQSEEQGIVDIVVTAQRREENLQRAAVPVTAIGSEELISAGVTSPESLNRLVPALVVQPTGLSTSFFIRGVGAASLNSFQENAVAFSVGGVFFARPTAPAGSFFDLERIEVVKGPQGTLYGRNATAGAINLVPVAPSLEIVNGTVLAEYGNYDSKKLSGAINVPLGSIAALRVSGQYVDRDGYLSDGYDDENGWAVRAQLLVEPSDRLSVLLAADYYKQGGRGIGTVLVPTPQAPTAPDPALRIGASDPSILAVLQGRTLATFSTPPFSNFPVQTRLALISYPGTNGFIRSKFWGTSATVKGDLDFADLTAILAYRKSQPDTLTYSPGFPGIQIEDNDQITAEVRLSSKPGARLGYVLGAFLFDEKQSAFNNFSQGLLADTTYRPQLQTNSKAIFGQLTFNVTDAFRLVAGGRYTFEHKTMEGDTKNTSFFIPVAPFVPISGDLSYKEPTWKAGVEFDLGPRSLLYANVATGFKAGGFYPSAGTNTFLPERLTAFTLGSKNRFLDNTLQVNIEAFYWKYRDQQLTYVGPVESTPGNFAQAGVTVNAGKARMYGIEAEIVYQPTRHDTLGVTVQYLNSKYDRLIYNAISSSGAPLLTNCAVSNDTRVATPPTRLFIVDCSGRPGLNSPEWTANLSYQHVFELGANYELTFGARSRIESSSWINFDYLDFQKRSAFTNTDAYLTLANKPMRWSITGFVSNIEDSTVYQGALTRPIINVTLFSLRPPRTYGIRAGIDF